MRFNEYDFTTVQTVRKRCIHFAKDGDTVVKHWRELYPMEAITGHREFSGLYLEHKKKDYAEYFRIYNDLRADCVEYGYLSGWYGVTEEAVEHLKKYVPFIGLEGYKLWLAQMEQKGTWINNAMIRGLADSGELELAAHYQEYHDNLARLNAEKRAIAQAELERKRQEEEQLRQEEREAQILATEKALYLRQPVDNVSFDGNTIILYLMKKHGIIPPLRTQGWINERLIRVTFQHDSISLLFQKTKGKKGSPTAVDCLFQLREKIHEIYSADQAA